MSEVQKFRHILVIEDRKGRRIIPLEQTQYTIGRDSNNSVVLYDYQVSRTHASLIRQTDGDDDNDFSYRILDGNLQGKKSTNGISINGRSMPFRDLKHGDSIFFANEAKASYYIVNTESGIDLFNPEGLDNIAASRVTLESQSSDTMIAKESKGEVSEEQQELIRLASFPELSPNPIIELDSNGNLTYLNPAASFKFDNIHKEKLNHPILKDLLSEDSNRQGNLFLREVKIGKEIQLQAHLSLLIYPIDGENPSLLIKNSLLSLEQAKAGKNSSYGVTGFNLTPKSASLLKLETLIGNAVQEQQFFLCYQPQIDSNTQKFTGLEALLRWNHPELGKVTPRHFLRLTEETEFMLPLGVWILQTATLQIKKWIEEGISPLPIGINISNRQFIQPNFVATIVKILEQTQLPPSLLELELRENCFLQNPEIAYKTLEKLSALKVRLCLDSFGSGNSALIHLPKIPFNTVKISPSIINKIDNDQKVQALVQSISVLCQGYDCRLIAVGVEKLEQMELLRGLGCTLIQGNLFSRPLPSKEASIFLHQSEKKTKN